MRVIRVLSIIGLAVFLILQGVIYFALKSMPEFHNYEITQQALATLRAIAGIFGFISGVLIFVSFSNWINYNKEK